MKAAPSSYEFIIKPYISASEFSIYCSFENKCKHSHRSQHNEPENESICFINIGPVETICEALDCVFKGFSSENNKELNSRDHAKHQNKKDLQLIVMKVWELVQLIAAECQESKNY